MASKIVGINYSKLYQKKSKLEIEAMFNNYVYNPRYLVAEDNSKILGFAGYIQSWMDYNFYQMFWVNVLPEHQGKGIGTTLVKRIIQLIKNKKDAYFILLTTTKPKFYERFGFKIMMKYRNNYVLMILDLKKK
ncbi:MAG: GNAT family N-acetyltransferase [Candidatus Micrarchaeota archaeon]|nr:GNAT family N-acetyltransferase [Candidatus Micrarchaeota archaeon]